jgi:hypothetical protein
LRAKNTADGSASRFRCMQEINTATELRDA